MIPGKQYSPDVLLQLAWRRKWLILLPAVVIAGGFAAYTYHLPDEYRAQTLIQVIPPRVLENYVRAPTTARLDDRLQTIGQQILSRTRLERIIEEFNLYADRRRSEIMEDIVEAMRKDIGMRVVRGDAFHVSFTSSDPRTAVRITERLASLFIDESLRDREVLTEGTNQFLEAQLEEARRALVDEEKKLEEYRRRHEGELPAQQAANLQGLHNAELYLQALLDSMSRDRDRRLILERTISDAAVAELAAANAPVAADAPAPRGAADQLRLAEAALVELLLRLKPEHPDVARLRRTIAELRSKADVEALNQPVNGSPPRNPLETMRRTRLEDAKTELASLEKQLADKAEQEKRVRAEIAMYQRRIENGPTREAELAELTRDYGTLQQTYRSLLSKKQESQIAANLQRRQIGEQFRVLDPPRLPTKPYRPDRPRYYALGVILGLGAGLLLAALVDYLDRSMRSEDDVMIALNLPVLATIPTIHSPESTRRRLPPASAALGMLAAALTWWAGLGA